MSSQPIYRIKHRTSGSPEALYTNIFSADSGFSVFRRRIEAAVQECGGSVDDLEKETLYDYYRSGESETFGLAALGCDESFN